MDDDQLERVWTAIDELQAVTQPAPASDSVIHAAALNVIAVLLSGEGPRVPGAVGSADYAAHR